ncbi:MAG: hypothetical protein WCR12_05045 [Dysgonamonadaceae bacterium]
MKTHFLILLSLLAVILNYSNTPINKNDKKDALPDDTFSVVEQNGKLSVIGVMGVDLIQRNLLDVITISIINRQLERWRLERMGKDDQKRA